MTSKETFKKAIEKANENGYKDKPDDIFVKIDTDDDVDDALSEVMTDMFNVKQSPLTIFSHDFAKAFWKHPDDCEIPEDVCSRHQSWQGRLQQMVLEEDAIGYLEKFL